MHCRLVEAHTSTREILNKKSQQLLKSHPVMHCRLVEAHTSTREILNKESQVAEESPNDAL